MEKPATGFYAARVTDGGTTVMHADEDAVCDHQTAKIFKDRDKCREGEEKLSVEESQKAARAAAKRKRQLWYMIKDVAGLIGTAALVLATYRFGLYVAIAAITGCVVAAGCRVTGYIERQGG